MAYNAILAPRIFKIQTINAINKFYKEESIMDELLGKIVRMLADFPVERLRVAHDLLKKIHSKEGGELFAEIKKLLYGKKRQAIVAKKNFLEPIFEGERLFIGATDGTQNIAYAKDVFGQIDPSFKKLKTDVSDQSRPRTLVEVNKLKKVATFLQMFGELNNDLHELCLTQHQIKSFVREHYNCVWLCPVLYLFESEGKFVVARVAFTPNGSLMIHKYNVENKTKWSVNSGTWVVVPAIPQPT
jgi:hypothetical protein